MKREPNLFERLGLTRAIVRELGPEGAVAFANKLAKVQLGLLHPDRSGDVDAFLEVSEASEELRSLKDAEAYARVLAREDSFDKRKRETEEGIALAQQELDASTERYLQLMSSCRFPVAKQNGELKLKEGRRRRTLSVKDGRVAPFTPLPGYQVMNSWVVGTITSPPSPFAEDLAHAYAADISGGRPSFAVNDRSGDYTPVSLALTAHVERCIRPYDPGREVTLVSIYWVARPKQQDSLHERMLWLFEGAIVDWSGTPLPPGKPLPGGHRLTGPEVVRQFGTDDSVFKMVIGCIETEYSRLHRRYWNEFLSYATVRIYESQLRSYIPEKGSLPGYLRAFAKNMRLHFLRDVVFKEVKTTDPSLLEALLRDPGLSPEDDLYFKELRKLVFMQLGNATRSAAERYFLKGQTYEQIAAELWLDSPGKAKNKVDQARKEINKLLGVSLAG